MCKKTTTTGAHRDATVFVEQNVLCASNTRIKRHLSVTQVHCPFFMGPEIVSIDTHTITYVFQCYLNIDYGVIVTICFLTTSMCHLTRYELIFTLRNSAFQWNYNF